MSRYVEITKDGNNYTVNPNATPSAEAPSFSNNIIYVMKGNMNICGIMANGTFLQNENDIPDVKWWCDISGGPSYRYFYTTGTDDITDVYSSEYITSWSLETYTNCQITYSGGTLRIYNETEGIDMSFSEYDTMPLACFALINPTS